MRYFLIAITLSCTFLFTACGSTPEKDSGAESSDQNEPAPRSRSRSY